jgi:hypothetical protein
MFGNRILRIIFEPNKRNYEKDGGDCIILLAKY